MNKKSRISFGPGAASLILIVVVLSMSILGILALMNAHNDARLTDRSVEVIKAEYMVSDAAERTLASVDTIAARCAESAPDEASYLDLIRISLPSGLTLNDHVITWTETDGYRTLDCAVEVMPLGGDARLRWIEHRMTAITEDVWS